jgi:hypothetical protein
MGPGSKAMAEEPEILNTDSPLKLQSLWSYETLFFLTSCYISMQRQSEFDIDLCRAMAEGDRKP